LPKREARVSQEILHPGDAPSLATSFLDGFDPPKLPERCIPRFLWLHSALNVRLGLHLDVRPYFLIHLRIEFPFAKQRTQSGG